jgi:hypothetical protein
MRHLFKLVLVGLIFTNVALARSLHPETFTRKAELISWDFDPSSNLAKLDILDGQVKVNAVTKYVSLSFQYPMPCEPNMFCAAVMESTEIKIGLVEVVKDGCGVVTYTGRQDKRPVDGAMTEIIVRDNSNSICEILYPAMTTIELNYSFYNRLTGQEIVQNSFLRAQQLKN